MEDSKSDAEIIERRFVGKEDSFNFILKLFSTYVDTAKRGDTSDGSNYREHLRKELGQLEHLVNKAMLMENVNRRQLENYQSLHGEIADKQVEEAQAIGRLKQELAAEKKERQRNEEYEALKKLINQVPSRQDTQHKIEELTKELEKLHNEKLATANELEMKRKQFGVFFHSLGQLKDNWDTTREGSAAQGDAMQTS